MTPDQRTEVADLFAEHLSAAAHYGETTEDCVLGACSRALRWLRENTVTPDGERRLLEGEAVKETPRPPVSNAPLGPPWPERRTAGVMQDGVYFPPNACAACGRWFPPHKGPVPSEVADQYCWGDA